VVLLSLDARWQSICFEGIIDLVLYSSVWNDKCQGYKYFRRTRGVAAPAAAGSSSSIQILSDPEYPLRYNRTQINHSDGF
jgi:hypothetical protein